MRIHATGMRVHAKVGTQSMLIFIHPEDTNASVGDRIRFRDHRWGKWETGILDALEPILFITRF